MKNKYEMPVNHKISYGHIKRFTEKIPKSQTTLV